MRGDCILVGDDPVRDHDGGIAAGYRAVHLVDRPNSTLKTISERLITSV